MKLLEQPKKGQHKSDGKTANRQPETPQIVMPIPTVIDRIQLNKYVQIDVHPKLESVPATTADQMNLNDHDERSIQPQDIGTISRTQADQVHSRPSRSNSNVSLEMGHNETILRSDDLIRKLRLLLQLRKDELQHFEGSIYSSALERTPTPFIVSNDTNSRKGSSMTSSEVSSVVDERRSDASDGNCMLKGRRLFEQRGIFSIITSSSKKAQQDTNRNHVLEIC